MVHSLLLASTGYPVGVPSDAQPRPVELDAAEREAIGVLAASGLVPPLRMVRAV